MDEKFKVPPFCQLPASVKGIRLIINKIIRQIKASGIYFVPHKFILVSQPLNVRVIHSLSYLILFLMTFHNPVCAIICTTSCPGSWLPSINATSCSRTATSQPIYFSCGNLDAAFLTVSSTVAQYGILNPTSFSPVVGCKINFSYLLLMHLASIIPVFKSICPHIPSE